MPGLELEKRNLLLDKKNELQCLLLNSAGNCESGDLADNERMLNDIKFSISFLENEHKLAKNAISKIKDNEYGFCESCDINIAVKRLNFLPFTPYCVDCQDYFERKSKARIS